jgi:hypothetical protein
MAYPEFRLLITDESLDLTTFNRSTVQNAQHLFANSIEKLNHVFFEKESWFYSFELKKILSY